MFYGRFMSTPETAADGKRIEVLTDENGRVVTVLGANASGLANNVDIHVEGVPPQMDNTDILAASLWGKDTAAGDVALNASAAGNLETDIHVAGVPPQMDDTDKLAISMYASDGTTPGVDAWRNNVEATALASAARTATTTSPRVTNHNARGILIQMDITVNPGGAETLKIFLRAHDPVVGAVDSIAVTTADAIGGGTGHQLLLMYPGAVGTAVQGNGSVHVNGALPRDFDIQVVHSAAGSWTYSVGYALIV